MGEFFPLSAVHGMLAAIGVIIIVKQLPVALGVQARGEPLEMIKDIPQYFRDMNPEIAFVGGIGVLIMFLWPIVQKAITVLKPVPAALVVILATVPLGIYFDMMHTHTYSFHGHKYEIGESFLVNMPDRVFGMFDYITTPDFAAFDSEHRGEAFKWVMMFFIIGSLESILSAKAVDIIDPWKRKTNMDRDILAVGVANLCASSIGGLPMISEIVRSKANIDNGARTRFADMWHGIFPAGLRGADPDRVAPHSAGRPGCYADLHRVSTHPSARIHAHLFNRQGATLDLRFDSRGSSRNGSLDRYLHWHRCEAVAAHYQWRACAFLVETLFRR